MVLYLGVLFKVVFFERLKKNVKHCENKTYELYKLKKIMLIGYMAYLF